jgi:hypothetical protein
VVSRVPTGDLGRRMFDCGRGCVWVDYAPQTICYNFCF